MYFPGIFLVISLSSLGVSCVTTWKYLWHVYLTSDGCISLTFSSRLKRRYQMILLLWWTFFNVDSSPDGKFILCNWYYRWRVWFIYKDMVDHRNSYTRNLSSVKLKPDKKFRPEQNSNLCDTGGVLYQLSYQVIWELVTLWVRNIPVEVKNANESMKDHIFELRRMKTCLIINVIHTT